MNRTTFSYIILTLVFTLSIVHNSAAQETNTTIKNLRIADSSHVQILTTLNGSKNIGRIIEIRESEIIFKSDVAEMTIPIAKIRDIEEVSTTSFKKGEYWFPNPNSTRLYFAPTADMLEKGKGYFADYYLFFPAIAFGVTNNFTLGGGLSLIPNVDMNKQVFYLTPKVGIKATEKFKLAVGALLIKIPGFSDDDDEDESSIVGILYGVSTIGSPDGSFTAGLGYGFVDNEFADKPMIVLGGEKRLSKRIAFVTENWLFPGVDQPLISYGFRFMGEKLSVDFAMLTPLGEDMIFPGIPYIDFVYVF